MKLFPVILLAAVGIANAAPGIPMPVKTLNQQHEIEVIAAPDGTMLAGWTDDVAPNPKDNTGWRCSFSVSHDHGKSWSTPQVYKNADYQFSGNPTVASDAQGNLYAVCMSVVDDDNHSRGTLEISRSTDHGVNWSAWETITSKSASYIPDRPKLIASGQQHLDLAYTLLDNTVTHPSVIQYLSSDNGGKSWSKEISLSPAIPADSDGDQGAKLVRNAQGKLLISWGRYNSANIYFAASTDNQHFSTPIIIDTHGNLGEAPCTEMAVDNRNGDMIWIARYTGHAFDQIDLVKSLDGGKTWQVMNPLSRNGINPNLQIDTKLHLHLSWTERKGQYLETLYAVSLNAGSDYLTKSLTGSYLTSFAADDPFLGGQIGSYQSLILTPDNNTYIFWIDWRSNNAALYYANLQTL